MRRVLHMNRGERERECFHFTSFPSWLWQRRRRKRAVVAERGVQREGLQDRQTSKGRAAFIFHHDTPDDRYCCCCMKVACKIGKNKPNRYVEPERYRRDSAMIDYLHQCHNATQNIYKSFADEKAGPCYAGEMGKRARWTRNAERGEIAWNVFVCGR